MDNTHNRDDQLRIILLANQPRMLREMLHRALDRTPGVRLVLETDNPHQILSILARVQANWLISSLDAEGQLPVPVQEALRQNPSLSALGLSADGSHVEVRSAESSNEQRERRCCSLDNVSLSELLVILGDKQAA